MGHLHLLLDEMGLEEMGLDKMGINHVTVAFLIVRVHSVYRVLPLAKLLSSTATA